MTCGWAFKWLEKGSCLLVLLILDVTKQTTFSFEKRKFVPSALLALKIARFFNKSFEKVFFLIDDFIHFLGCSSVIKVP